MNYSKAIEHIYSEIENFTDFGVEDKGEGQFISYWNYSQPQPTQEQLEAAWVEVQEKETQEAINKESIEYLASTDWYVIRKQETGVEVPADILVAREEARNKVV